MKVEITLKNGCETDRWLQQQLAENPEAFHKIEAWKDIEGFIADMRIQGRTLDSENNPVWTFSSH